MTDSDSPAEPAKDPSGESAPPKALPRPRRTGPRRASLPAGSPARVSAAPSLLVLDAGGLVAVAPDVEAPAPEAEMTPPPETVPKAAPTPEVDTQSTPPPEPDTDTDTDTEAAPTPAVDTQSAPPPEPDTEAAPLTRRARRLAGDAGPAADVVPPSRKVPVAPVARPAPARARQPNRAWAWLRGLLFLILISVIVVGAGTVVTGHDTAAGPSVTEVNRGAAWARTSVLLAQARAAHDAQKDPAVKALLGQGADALKLQLAALDGPLPADGAAPPAAAAAAAGVTATSFAKELAGSANTLLADALTAGGAMGRTFAAAGTNRLLLASALDRQLGSPAPESAYLPAAVQPVPADTAACKAVRQPQPGNSGDAAITAAAQAEQKAVYAYQVAGSRLPEPGFSQALGLGSLHQNNLDLLNAALAQHCLPVVAPAPGFVLAPGYTTAPAAALAKLEGGLVLVYGDLAAFSPASAGSQSADFPAPDIRAMAVAGMVQSASRQQEWGGPLDALPGIAAGPSNGGPTVPASVPAAP
ncbi:DUF4439 domain-containing protein [Arthrobacter sp. STN4]|uniref:DUF4439 domain-containing protein n=1 Tax=Arthrobacter sp. STN4 TaxID=2923276 RepID=UPI00211A6C45|nr:DUF4439 domain-containing protein [Arthrobacter sp. STN4]MCQ9165637.1 DUF4439 domain-containing protein [Arthrobacter sp. STN4]